MSWITESNRQKHFKYGILCGFVGTFLFALGVAMGLEYKDYAYGNKWDWLDIAATLLGGLVGQLLQVLLLFLIYWC
ncbi:MAG: hypothetical protein OSJ42_09740 [Bacteroidales bacterium]|nr:hypothetical protein [Bacteroidales bacterium]